MQEYIPTGLGSPINECVDNEFHSNPTCGWARTSANGANLDILWVDKHIWRCEILLGLILPFVAGTVKDSVARARFGGNRKRFQEGTGTVHSLFPG